MKNIFLTLGILSILGGTLQAQAYKGGGDMKIQVGFSPYGHGSGLTGTFDYGLHEIFSIGGGVELYFSKDNDNFYIFGRADAHLGKLINLPEDMDLYPGIDLGLLGNNFGFGAHLGYRYFFKDNIGVYIEVGSRGSFGLIFNL